MFLFCSLIPVKLPDAIAQMDRTTALQARDEGSERRAMAHEIKLDGYRMAARIEDGRVKLLTRSGLDWTAEDPLTAAAFAKLKVTIAYLDGKPCGFRPAGCNLVRSANRITISSSRPRIGRPHRPEIVPRRREANLVPFPP
jgi:hypothetical protein